MLQINNLQFERDEKVVFSPINLHIQPGECVQCVGENGAGKTTFLKIVAGLLKARRGSILWHGEKISSCLKISKYLGHELALKSGLSVDENLQFYAQLMCAELASINHACNYFHLKSLRDRWVYTLSAGQKHRTQLAKLMIGFRPLWLLDESFTALDQKQIQQLLSLIHQHTQQGGIVLFTSHQPIYFSGLAIREYHLESLPCKNH